MGRATRKAEGLANRRGVTETVKTESRITVDLRVLYPVDTNVKEVLEELEAAYFNLRGKIGLDETEEANTDA